MKPRTFSGATLLHNFFVNLTLAMQWFNPLVWAMYRTYLNEREKACDDHVLRSGFRASQYGECLIDFCKTGSLPKYVSKVGLAMAERGTVETRLQAILDSNRCRNQTHAPGIAATSMLIICVAAPLGLVQLNAKPLLVETAEITSTETVVSDNEFVIPSVQPDADLVIEPSISDEEKEVIEDIVDLIKESPSEAVQELENKITETSTAAFDFILANLYFQQGDLANAERCYKDAIAKHPDFQQAYKNLSLVQVQKGDLKLSIGTINKALELGVVDGQMYGLLGYGYFTEERYGPAILAYQKAVSVQPEVKDWKMGLIRCLLATQSYSDTIVLFDSLLAKEPNNSYLLLQQGNAYIEMGEHLVAAKNLERVRQMGAADLSTLSILGDLYLNNTMPELALDVYLSAVEKATVQDSEVLVRAAELFIKSEHYEEAKVMLSRIRAVLGSQINADTELKLLTLEAKMARIEGDDGTSLALLIDVVARDALNGEALIELANAYADRGEMDKATVRYERAANIEPFERRALVAHAHALVHERDYQQAVPLLQRALQIKEDDALQDYLQRVEKAARSRG